MTTSAGYRNYLQALIRTWSLGLLLVLALVLVTPGLSEGADADVNSNSADTQAVDVSHGEYSRFLVVHRDSGRVYTYEEAYEVLADDDIVHLVGRAAVLAYFGSSDSEGVPVGATIDWSTWTPESDDVAGDECACPCCKLVGGVCACSMSCVKSCVGHPHQD